MTKRTDELELVARLRGTALTEDQYQAAAWKLLCGHWQMRADGRRWRP